jgi:signal transduction histidine kinase
MSAGPRGRSVRGVSVDHATTSTFADLRKSRAEHEATLRRIRICAPIFLVVFVLSAYQAHPGPGLAGRSLAISLGVAGYVLAILGAVVTSGGMTPPGTARPRVASLLAIAGIVLASSVMLLCLQPTGPGAEGAFVGVLFFARLLPGRLAFLLSAAAFVVLEVVIGFSGQGLAGLVILGALAACYGLMFLAVRLREANEQAEALLVELEQTRAIEAQAAGMAERQRLAREMHDVLAHSLSGLLLQLEGARMLAADDPSDPRLPEAIDRAHHLGKTGLEEARRAIGMLRDDQLPGPEGLAELVARFEEDRGIPCQLMVSGQEYPLGSEARVALYRVAQEALTNVTKHARPERVELHLAYEPDATRLRIEDFADTMGTLLTPAGNGYGLTGMRERAELLGGTLTTEPTCSGFRVELDVPA